MTKPIRIDFVSDVSCPWCAIGLGNLDAALKRLEGTAEADLHFQPFELNPDMAPEGEDRFEHLSRKYGIDRAQARANREKLQGLAANVGFEMSGGENGRIHNTFDAHRLLRWAEEEGRQVALKRALLAAYHTHGQDPSDHEVLLAAAESVGLDRDAAREVLTSDRYAEEVRAVERQWQRAGITGVPAVIVDGRYLVSGAQPPEIFEQVIRKALTEAA